MSLLPGFISLFRFYQNLANKTIESTSTEHLFMEPAKESNSMALVMKHLAGNMLSRWTDFLTSDGEKPWRNRDQEFELYDQDREALMRYWSEGWQCLFNTLQSLQDENLNQFIFIRGEKQTVQDAIYRQLAHYAYHVGQIVYIGKMYQGEHWISLSIPKGKSEEYNAKKFNEEKKDGHFTDEWIEK